jgi:hypothetical protein
MFLYLLHLAAFASGFLWSAPPFRLVLVDAFTRRPLPGVVARAGNQRASSDAEGVVVLPSRPVKVQFTYAGYSTLTTMLAGETDKAVTDTIGLLPKPIILAEAVVNSKQLLLSTTGQAYKSPYRYATNLLIPGNKIAVVYQRPDSSKRYYIREIELHFVQKFAEGRIRVKVVALGDDGKPLDRGLLPDTVFSTRQLSRAKNDWATKIDVSRYDLFIPARGAAVMVECLPSAEQETMVGTRKIEEPGNAIRMMVDTQLASAGTATARSTPFFDYPQLSTSMEFVAQSWVWRKPSAQWTLNKWGIKNQEGQYMGNPVVRLLVNQL